jgi:1,4-alpha-glucan branching enzyme
MPDGHFMLVLHAHLPFIRHPEDPFFIEENWLVEAITETYIPILQRMERLADDGIRARLTLTVTPPLCEMLADGMLMDRYRQRIIRLLELAEQEVPAKANSPFAAAAVMYRDHFRFCLRQLERWRGNLINWICNLRDRGVVEPITCTATHGFLPLMHTTQARRAQIQVAVANYVKHFGQQPRGMWLAECGFVPGIEELLREQGLRYFFVDTHGLYFGEPRPRYGVFAPCFTPSGVAVFARDPESSRSVWSQQTGYPGDVLYREFYRDLGYDGEYGYVKNFLHPDGVRRNLGLKYHRITGKVDLHQKAAYEPAPAFARAMDHAGNFHYNRVNQCRWLTGVIDRPPLIVSPYDAELFGHWWFEGTQFIESIFRCCHQHGYSLEPVTGSEYLERFPVNQVVMPAGSSWGDAGYNGVWLNPSNDWIYRHLHLAEERMIECAQRFPDAGGDLKRALDQMARELLLMQASDWAFIMTTGTTVSYAVRRTKDHINRFTGLYEQVTGGGVSPETLHEIAWRDTIFPEIDYRVYA